MTRNEAIAEKMGWIIFKDKSLGAVAKDQDGDGFPFMPESITSDSPTGHWLAHLLIERMVEDGWRIIFCAFRNGTFEAEAIHEYTTEIDEMEHVVSGMLDFPTAVVELFCKVYGIKED